MVEKEWMQFASTGRINDYLAYSKVPKTGWKRNDTGSDVKEREQRDGADHCAYWYGVGSDTHWGL